MYVIVLFIEFPDDPSASTSWPKMTQPLAMMTDVIDMNQNAPSGKKHNITTYFKDMSGGKLVLVGHPVYKVARYPLAKYQAPISQADAVAAGWPGDAGQDFSSDVRYWATRHALEELDLRNNWDFTPYDRWTLTPNNPYNHTFAFDGHVDMIFTCWRNDGSRITGTDAQGNSIITQDPSFSGFDGIADMGDGPSILVGTTNPDPTKIRTIDFGFPGFGARGSGVTVLNMGQYPRMETVYHEFGHYLYDAGHHQYSGGMWALMGQRHPNISSCMSAYERSLLGWCTIVDITTDGQTARIQDFPTTRVAYRLTVNANNNQYYWIENHQRLNSPFITRLPVMDGRPWGNVNDDAYWNVMSYDIVDQAPGSAPGLYVVQQWGIGGGSVNVVCADGSWDWTQAACPNATVGAPWNPQQPLALWERSTIQRNSRKFDRSFLSTWVTCNPATNRGADFMWAWRDPTTGQAINNIPKHRGDQNDMWTIGEEYLGNSEWTLIGHNVFTPWSNPSTRNMDAGATIGFEVYDVVGTSYDVMFFTTNPELGSPSIPQDPKISKNWWTIPNSMTPGFWPELTWDANLEPDVNPDGSYEIWRRHDVNGIPAQDWVLAGTVDGDVTFWRDIWFGAESPDNVLHYKIRAVDEDGNASIFSEVRTVKQDLLGKPVIHPGRSDAESGLVLQSHPNPSTGLTAINYFIPSEGKVRLVVFDALGNLAAILVDESMAGGNHSIEFDATDLSPGIYTYRLQHGRNAINDRLIITR